MPVALSISPPLGISDSRVLRLATLSDLPNLLLLEFECFEADRRDTRSTIRRSLVNGQHETWVESCSGETHFGVAIFLRKVRNTLRIYSLSTLPDLRGKGWGNHLLGFAEERARARSCSHLSLEADASMPLLIEWYERKGFRRVRFLENYYDFGRHAWRMKRVIQQGA
jgi:[ribosomal protein S18]-alanine N-acetyltransferase